MEGISEVVCALEVNKKSKKRKGRESVGRDGDLQGTRTDEAEVLSTSASDTVAEVVSSVDMNNDSNRKKQNDTSRKEEKTDNNTPGLDLKDSVNDHKREKKSQIGFQESASNVEKQPAQEEGHINKKKKNKTTEPEVREKVDVEGVQNKAREDKVKKNKNKNKELSRKESDYYGVGRDDFIENQVNSGVVEHIEPVSDKKKKREEDLREDLLHDIEIHATSHQDNGGVSGSEMKKKDQAATTTVSSEGGDAEIVEKVASNKDKKPEKKNKDKGNSSNEENCANGGKGDGPIRGKRFSKEEDALVEKAVLDYIAAHQLGEQGVHMVMNCKEYPKLKYCWKQIGKAIPWRPYDAVYRRAHILFERGQARNKWTAEELELLRKFHKQHGAKWKTLADQLGKHRVHVRNAWRWIKPANLKKGGWSQDEYQSLFDLVNMDLSLKAFQDKKSKQGMLRDNISWEAISDKLATRPHVTCCLKWYNQLSSPLVAQGKWSDTDDYKLLIALVELDAACEEDVDWDNLLEHRSGDICRKRWHQMVLHIGENAIKPFNEQVEILSNRYCPHLLQPREAYANKPFVDC